MPNLSTTAVYCSAVLALAACSTTTTQSFRVTESSNVEAAFIATDADFSKYHQLLARDMGRAQSCRIDTIESVASKEDAKGLVKDRKEAKSDD